MIREVVSWATDLSPCLFPPAWEHQYTVGQKVNANGVAVDKLGSVGVQHSSHIALAGAAGPSSVASRARPEGFEGFDFAREDVVQAMRRDQAEVEGVVSATGAVAAVVAVGVASRFCAAATSGRSDGNFGNPCVAVVPAGRPWGYLGASPRRRARGCSSSPESTLIGGEVHFGGAGSHVSQR